MDKINQNRFDYYDVILMSFYVLVRILYQSQIIEKIYAQTEILPSQCMKIRYSFKF